jgi:HD superfamily phosphohydrolase
MKSKIGSPTIAVSVLLGCASACGLDRIDYWTVRLFENRLNADLLRGVGLRTTKIITDPIYQEMSFGSDPEFIDIFKKVIDTKVFQRLRRITQLGLASYVFPGATHTRFSHSLGVAYLARTVLVHLKETESPIEITPSKFNSVVLAALLHDIGHGPFSHSFERMLDVEDAPDHEEWTRLLISQETSDVGRCLRQGSINVESIRSVFGNSSSSGLDRPLTQIVSSQLDVDRMDYLIRDSHFAGLAVGRFDVNYLIHSLAVIKHRENGPATLGINRKGVKAYEGFCIARQLMNRTLYYHHNIQVLEYMMERFLRLVIKHLDDIKGASAELIPRYFRRVATALQGTFVKQDFMNEAYADYVVVSEDSVWTVVAAAAEGRLTKELATPAEQLLTRDILEHLYISPGKKGLLGEALRDEGFKVEEDFHLLDSETTMYKGLGGRGVFVLDEQNNVEEVTKHSETISAFRDRPEIESFLVLLNPSKAEGIKRTADGGQFLLLRNKRQGPSRILPKSEKQLDRIKPGTAKT